MRTKALVLASVLMIISLVACGTAPILTLTPEATATLPATAAPAATATVPATAAPAVTAASMSPSGTQTVNVSLTTYGFKFSSDQIQPGDTKFVVKNDASDVMHELWVVKTDLAVDQLPMIADGSKVDEASTTFTKLGSVDDLGPGKTGEMTVTLQTGRYVIFCNQPGHYKAGMRGQITVAPNAASTEPQIVNATLTTYGFKFDPATIKPGMTKFVVKNDATDVMHELWIVKTDLPMNKLPLISDNSKIDEASTTFTKLDSVDDLGPGKTGEMTVTLQTGRYVYFCNQPGHYMAGMRGEFTVAP